MSCRGCYAFQVNVGTLNDNGSTFTSLLKELPSIRCPNIFCTYSYVLTVPSTILPQSFSIILYHLPHNCNMDNAYCLLVVILFYIDRFKSSLPYIYIW